MICQQRFRQGDGAPEGGIIAESGREDIDADIGEGRGPGRVTDDLPPPFARFGDSAAQNDPAGVHEHEGAPQAPA